MSTPYEIEYTRDSVKAIRGMPAGVRANVLAKIAFLSTNPFAAQNVKKLVGRDGYRLRVGDWRVIYEVDAGRLVILVLAVASRGGVYK